MGSSHHGSTLRRMELTWRAFEGDQHEGFCVGSTDEIGAVELGFNEMTERIAQSYQALETKNRQLAEAWINSLISKP